RPLTFRYTSQNMKAASTPASITREAGERKTARIATMTTAPMINNTLRTSSSRSNALQTR
ncbi:hypothetical protein A1F97_11370, partial [Pyrenophora tritici-repentis]